MTDLCKSCLAKEVCMLNHQANDKKDSGVIFTACQCPYYRQGSQSNIIDTQSNHADILSFEDVVQKMRLVDEASKKYDSVQSENNADVIEKALDEPSPCPICGKETTLLIKCDECGKYGCYDCMTSTVDDKMFCPDCF